MGKARAGGEQVTGGAYQASLFRCIDTVARIQKVARRARTHFDDYNRLAIAHYQVELTLSAAPVSRKRPQSFATQIGLRVAFGLLPATLPVASQSESAASGGKASISASGSNSGSPPVIIAHARRRRTTPYASTLSIPVRPAMPPSAGLPPYKAATRA